MPNLPELGVGLVYRPALEPLLEPGAGLVDLLEIEPQPFWAKASGESQLQFEPHALERIKAFGLPTLVHGVGMPLGSTLGLDAAQIRPFAESVSLLKAAWASEHLAFVRAPGASEAWDCGFILPPLQSEAGIAQAVRNVRTLKRHLDVPVAFENATNYLQSLPGEVPDGEFLARVAIESDCGIVLDLHNLWCNERNGRQSVQEVLAQLPLERVWEVHLPGGQEQRGLRLDSRAGETPQHLIEIAQELIPRLSKLRALVFEVMPEHLSAGRLNLDLLARQLGELRGLWAPRGSRAGQPQPAAPVVRHLDPHWMPSPPEWETALARQINKRPVQNVVQAALSEDPGVHVLSDLVENARASILTELLPLGCRLISLRLGEAGLQQLMEGFWGQRLPASFGPEEARHFVEFIDGQDVELPHLSEVLAYELASLDLLSGGPPQRVKFGCDPEHLLRALGRGELPKVLPLGNYIAQIT